MKTKIIVIVASLMLNSAVVAEFPLDNPDQYPSVALHYTAETIDGRTDLSLMLATNVPGLFAGGSGPIESEIEVSAIVPSFRWPVTNSLTLDLSASFTKQKISNEATGFSWGGTLEGGLYTGGVRFYFNQ